MKVYHAKIYLIRHKKTKDVIYVGSTIQTLEQRFRNHCNGHPERMNYKMMHNHKEDYEIVQIDDAYSEEERYLKEEFWTEFYMQFFKLNNIYIGKKRTEESNRKMAERVKGLNKGHKCPEWKKKHDSEFFAGWDSPTTRQIYCYEKKKKYKSITACAKDLGMTQPALYHQLRKNNFEFAHGFHFKVYDRGEKIC